jgi:hypothetical protein
MFCIYLEESAPKAASKDHAGRNAVLPAASAETLSAEAETLSAEAVSAETRQIVRREVGVRWAKFSEQELAALDSRDDLVRELVTRYGIEKSEAQRDVDLVLKGRGI